MTEPYDMSRAWEFLRGNARVLECRLAEFVLGDRPTKTGPMVASSIVAALAAYRNPDGGLGHALEPDVRAPDSQPLAVDFAFHVLDGYGLLAEPAVTKEIHTIATDAVDYLAGLTHEGRDGAPGVAGVPIVLPSIKDHPRAAHWGDGEFPPSLNPTAGIVARARLMGVEHPWLDRAAAFCWEHLDDPDGVLNAHEAVEVLRFLETDPDRSRAVAAYEELGTRLNDLATFLPYPGEGYGLTPLSVAATPDSPRRRFFSDAQIDAHLDVLASAQCADGGWSITWTAPTAGAEREWRGVTTLDALRTLRAYRR